MSPPPAYPLPAPSSAPLYIHTCLLCCVHVVSPMYLTWHFKPNKYNEHSCMSWSPHLKRMVFFCHWAVFLQPSYDQLCNYKTAWMTWIWKSLLSLPSIWLNILRHTGSLRLTLYVSCPVMVPAFWVLNYFLWVLGFVCLSCLYVTDRLHCKLGIYLTGSSCESCSGVHTLCYCVTPIF